MSDTQDTELETLSDEAASRVRGGNRREFDHIGNFNFKVEIEGVTRGGFSIADSRTDVSLRELTS